MSVHEECSYFMYLSDDIKSQFGVYPYGVNLSFIQNVTNLKEILLFKAPGKGQLDRYPITSGSVYSVQNTQN